MVLNSLWLADECVCLDVILLGLQKTNKQINQLKFIASEALFSDKSYWLLIKINVAKTQNYSSTEIQPSELHTDWLDYTKQDITTDWLVNHLSWLTCNVQFDTWKEKVQKVFNSSRWYHFIGLSCTLYLFSAFSAGGFSVCQWVFKVDTRLFFGHDVIGVSQFAYLFSILCRFVV